MSLKAIYVDKVNAGRHKSYFETTATTPTVGRPIGSFMRAADTGAWYISTVYTTAVATSTWVKITA